MEGYFLAKRGLFTGIAPPPAAVNVGDPYGRRLAEELASTHRAPLVTYGLRPEAEVRADGLDLGPRGSRFSAAGIPIVTPLLGVFNVENVLGAVAAALLLEVDEDAIVERLLKRAETEGRADDTEDVVRRRQEVYGEQTEPLIDVYRGRGLLIEVDGLGEIDEVSERIFSSLSAVDES